jgi:hypothetical protein
MVKKPTIEELKREIQLLKNENEELRFLNEDLSDELDMMYEDEGSIDIFGLLDEEENDDPTRILH